MREWDSLVAGSLLGTDRQSPALPQAEGALGAVLGSLDPGEPARSTLSAAAALSLYRRAGWVPPRDAAPPPPAADINDLPLCSSAAALRLDGMLRGTSREVLPEWLTAVAARGRRVPAEALPALLELGRTQAPLRPAILSVLGARGRWLAAQNPAWDYSAGQLSQDDWGTGSRDARVALLTQLRKEDPVEARTLLESGWAEETHDDRARFLALLETGLSMADEPFLEAALDDRRKEVRKTAADLLARLPESRFCLRMVARVEPLFAYQKKLLGRGSLEVQLPEACDRAMVRDGIEPKPPQYGAQKLGEKSWWLLQLVTAVPPQHWTTHFKLSPADLTEAARKSEWKEVLWEGWAHAAARYQATEWLDPILAVRPRQDEVLRELVRSLPSARRETMARQLLQGKGRLAGNHLALLVLAEHNEPWSRELSRLVLQTIRTHLRGLTDNDRYDWQLRTTFLGSAYHLAPDILPEFVGEWPVGGNNAEYWTTVVQELLTILQFRHDMLQELAP